MAFPRVVTTVSLAEEGAFADKDLSVSLVRQAC